MGSGSQTPGKVPWINQEEIHLAPSCFAAAIENRAKEIGLAVLDVDQSKLTLTQLIEPSSTYTTFLMLLEVHQPKRLIVVVDRNAAVSFGLNHATRLYSQVIQKMFRTRI